MPEYLKHPRDQEKPRRGRGRRGDGRAPAGDLGLGPVRRPTGSRRSLAGLFGPGLDVCLIIRLTNIA